MSEIITPKHHQDIFGFSFFYAKCPICGTMTAAKDLPGGAEISKSCPHLTNVNSQTQFVFEQTKEKEN